tara:strand:- start:276 stop:584 length:309 start_codon:yes stop_codon:yes gene_type:complete
MYNLPHIYNLEFNILQSLGPLPIYLLIFAVIYFIMIRPQVKQQKQHTALLENLKNGDRIITNGGIVGKIVNIKGKNKEIIQISTNNSNIEILRSHIKSLHSK